MNSDENPPPAVEQETVRENPLEEFVEKEMLEEATAAGQAQRDLNPTKTEESLAHFLADVFSRRVRKRPVEWRGSLDVTWTNRQGWYFVARAALLRLNPLNVPSVEPQLSKSDSVSGSSQTIVEPSDGNALNLQMALEALRGLLDMIANMSPDDWQDANQESSPELPQITAAKKCLSSPLLETDRDGLIPLNSQQMDAIKQWAIKFEREKWRLGRVKCEGDRAPDFTLPAIFQGDREICHGTDKEQLRKAKNEHNDSVQRMLKGKSRQKILRLRRNPETRELRTQQDRHSNHENQN